MVPAIIDGVDLVLGKKWQNENRTQMNMGERPRLKIRPPMRSTVFAYPMGSVSVVATAQPISPEEDNTELREMTYKQAKRALDKHQDFFMIVVRERNGTGTEGTPERNGNPSATVAEPWGPKRLDSETVSGTG